MNIHSQPMLSGVRIHISGSVPDNATLDQANGIRAFVQKLASTVFSAGGAIIHGSHPSLIEPLKAAAETYIAARGDKNALTLVRAPKFATSQYDAEINSHREFSTVQIMPPDPKDNEKPLIPMREWMADRSDAIVAIGGRWWGINNNNAGVPKELELALSLGKPGFIVAGFGGATAGYLKEAPFLLSKLKNGLPDSRNREIAESTSIDQLVDVIVAQLRILPLVRQSIKHSRNFRILALDGGGIRGTFTAAVLTAWEASLKSNGITVPLVNHFDLVAGTSTGAILAIGLGLGLPPSKILEFYKKKGPQIFPNKGYLRHWLTSKYESNTLESLLKEVFGDKKLSYDSSCRLVIPTVRAINGESEAIVTHHNLDRASFCDISAVTAALASSAAPSYFDEAKWDNSVAVQQYLDGGIWANNPVLPVLAEAVRYLHIPLERIDVLSVGTLGCEPDFTEALRKGKLGWAPESADLFFAAQEHAAATMAQSFLGSTRLLRVNQQTREDIPLDKVKAIDKMAVRGDNVGKDTFSSVRSRFLDGSFAEDWRPADKRPKTSP